MLNLHWAAVLEEEIVGLQYNPFLKGNTQIINRFHTFTRCTLFLDFFTLKKKIPDKHGF